MLEYSRKYPSCFKMLTIKTQHFLNQIPFSLDESGYTGQPFQVTIERKLPLACTRHPNLLRNEDKSKLIIILKAYPADTLSFDTSICHTCVVKCFPLINIFRDHNLCAVKHYWERLPIMIFLPQSNSWHLRALY